MIDAGAEATPLRETPYGAAKRLHVIEQWLGQIAARLGRTTLSILDYGCGTGDQLTAPLARAGHRVVGVDMHAPSVAEASRRHQLPSLSFVHGDIAAVAASTDRFDVVICSEVLEHVTDPVDLLSQLRRLIRPDGALIITTPNGYGSFELLCSAERALRRVGVHQALRSLVWTLRKGVRRLRGLPPPLRPLDQLTAADEVGFLNFDSGHVQFFTTGALEKLFARAGFQIVGRRARTLLCGPYIDALFAICPWRERLFDWNNRAADLLPMAWAADWMFLLRSTE